MALYTTDPQPQGWLRWFSTYASSLFCSSHMDRRAAIQRDPNFRQSLNQQGAIQWEKAEDWMEVPSGLDLAHKT